MRKLMTDEFNYLRNLIVFSRFEIWFKKHIEHVFYEKCRFN